MTALGRQDRAHAPILATCLGIVVAAGCVACSGGGGAGSDAGAPGGGGGVSAGRGGASAGASGAAGSGGTATGGAAGIAGTVTGGAGGSAIAGTGGSGGGGGASVSATCGFDVQHAPSPAIGTVQIVTWTVDLAGLTEAHIEFWPSGASPSMTMTAPVDLREPLHRTVLVGMKGARPYTFRIFATDGVKSCASAELSFTTGAVPGGAPKITKTITKTTPGAGAAKGFIVTTPGVDVLNATRDRPDAFIFDTDGDIVWWTSQSLYNSIQGISRAHLAWDAKSLWVMASTQSKIVRVSMDGTTATAYGDAVKRAHHDFAPLPDGAIATLTIPTSGGPHAVVEIKPDGTVTTVVADLSTIYPDGDYPNAIHYYPADDSYTLGDRTQSAFIKLKRNGALVWQLGGANALGKSFRLVGLDQWEVNHGHHLTPDGRFLFFNNNGTGATSGELPWVLEVMLDEAAGTATKTWEYRFTDTPVAIALGDAERLPNGNALVTNSMGGLIQEVDRAGKVVQSFQNTAFGFGYVDFRTSLYGPPPR